MPKRLTDNDAFAAGIAAYAAMQALLNHLEATQAPPYPIDQIIEDAARSIEILIKETRPRHPAMFGAVRLLRESAQKRGKSVAVDPVLTKAPPSSSE